MMERTLLNIGLASLLLFQALPVSAANTASEMFGDFGVGHMQNNTEGFQEYRGANGEMVYGFGGSLVLKRPAQTFPQWYHIQAPEIAASCSGISFKGMFGSIVNFDEIERQFSEAGESLAWGIMVGIIYSLPGIGEIFSKLDAWAKKIQQMLANACRSGVAIGQALGGATMNAADDAVGGFLGNDPQAWYNKVGAQAGGLIDKIDTVLDCASTNSEWIDSGSCEDMKTQTRDELAVGYISTPSVFASAAFAFRRERGVFPFNTTEGEFTVVKPDSSLELASGAADFSKDLALAVIVTSVVGDVVLNEDDFLLLDTAMTIAFNEDGDAYAAEVRKRALKGLKSFVVSAKSYACRDLAKQGGTAESLMEDVARFLIYGNQAGATSDTPDTQSSSAASSVSSASSSSSSSSISGTSLARMLEYDLQMPHLGVFHAPGGVNTIDSYQVVAFEPYISGIHLHSQIQSPILNFQGAVVLAEDAKNCYLYDQEEACLRMPYNLFNIDAQKFLAKVYRNTLDPAEKGMLDGLFMDYAIYHMAEAINARIRAVLLTYSGMAAPYLKGEELDESTNVAKSTELIRCVTKVKTNLTAFANALDKVVDGFKQDRLNGRASPEAVYNVFVEQNRKNMQRALERINRK